MKSKKVTIIHTSFVSIEYLKQLFSRILPDVELSHIVDDSLLTEVMENGEVTPGVTRRICDYCIAAESTGTDAIFNQCSSVGEAADVASKLVKIPILKVDEAMAKEAISIGSKIAVVATVASTMGPSIRLVQEMARKEGKKIEIVECLVDGALKVLMQEGNRQKHNALVREKMLSLENDVDVFVLAQGSMVVLIPELNDIRKPVLTSPERGVKSMKRLLKLDI